MKSEALVVALPPADAGVRPIVREPVVRRLAAQAWWVACLLPALVLLAVIAGR
jgi:hypothetical protein